MGIGGNMQSPLWRQLVVERIKIFPWRPSPRMATPSRLDRPSQMTDVAQPRRRPSRSPRTHLALAHQRVLVLELGTMLLWTPIEKHTRMPSELHKLLTPKLWRMLTRRNFRGLSCEGLTSTEAQYRCWFSR